MTYQNAYSTIPLGKNDEHIFDYSKVSDFIFVGSDFCTGNECTFHEDEFRNLGISTEINLAAEKKETPPDDIDLYAWIPVIDGYAPTYDQLLLGTSIINETVKNGKRVYIHCRNGHSRSPSLLAAYFIRYECMSVEDAIQKIKGKRQEIHIEPHQVEALTTFASLVCSEQGK